MEKTSLQEQAANRTQIAGWLRLAHKRIHYFREAKVNNYVSAVSLVWFGHFCGRAVGLAMETYDTKTFFQTKRLVDIMRDRILTSLSIMKGA